MKAVTACWYIFSLHKHSLESWLWPLLGVLQNWQHSKGRGRVGLLSSSNCSSRRNIWVKIMQLIPWHLCGCLCNVLLFLPASHMDRWDGVPHAMQVWLCRGQHFWWGRYQDFCNLSCFLEKKKKEIKKCKAPQFFNF